MKRISILAGLVALFLVGAQPLAPLTVTANDRKSHAASLCTGHGSTMAYQQEGHVENTSSTTTVTATCPLLRDTVASNADVAFASVWVFDANPATNISCTLYSRGENDAFVDSETRSSSGSTGNIVSLSFAMPLHNVVDGFYFMSCSIPPTNAGARSGVTHYVIDEAE